MQNQRFPVSSDSPSAPLPACAFDDFLIETFDMQAILDYLKQSGERLDSEIAAATGLSLANVRSGVADLRSRGAIMVCKSIRYQDGKEIEGILCRISGYIPQAAPGRKPKAVTQAKAAIIE